MHALARNYAGVLFDTLNLSGSAKKFSELVNKCVAFGPNWPQNGARFVLI